MILLTGMMTFTYEIFCFEMWLYCHTMVLEQQRIVVSLCISNFYAALWICPSNVSSMLQGDGRLFYRQCYKGAVEAPTSNIS